MYVHAQKAKNTQIRWRSVVWPRPSSLLSTRSTATDQPYLVGDWWCHLSSRRVREEQACTSPADRSVDDASATSD